MLSGKMLTGTRTRAVVVVFIIALGAIGYGLYRYHALYQAELVINQSLTRDSQQLAEQLSAANIENSDLKTLLASRVEQLQIYTGQIQGLSTTVDTLNKLTSTDKELLEKYSAVYFLNENYIPKSLTPIDTQYLNRPDKSEQYLTGVIGHLYSLLNAARAATSNLQVLSAYRSFGQQAALKTGYKLTYGAGTANSFSADQGYSEHQLGTTVDFTTKILGQNLSGFDKSDAYAWLSAHAYEYGFELSYPKGNGYFAYEPWHWRYVGLELAKKLRDENVHFYDLPQRAIDTYLIKFFD